VGEGSDIDPPIPRVWHQLKSDRPKGRRLLAKHAFVVLLSPEASGTHDSFNGRAEHVVTGRAMHFETLDELLSFIQHVLVTLRESRKSAGGSGKA
jgi:hypothetical protein